MNLRGLVFFFPGQMMKLRIQIITIKQYEIFSGQFKLYDD